MFPVSIISSEPVWLSLPCAKITEYPLEKRDYKPYAQARMCISDKMLFVQMIAFEINPENESIVEADISFDNGGNIIRLSSNREGVNRCTAGSSDISRNVAIRVYTGEDEQGIYWAVNFSVPLESLEKYGIHPEIKVGNTVMGNFYKISSGKRKHCGSWMPCIIDSDCRILDPCLAEMEMTEY